jgi:hypothetical protein
MFVVLPVCCEFSQNRFEMNPGSRFLKTEMP